MRILGAPRLRGNEYIVAVEGAVFWIDDACDAGGACRKAILNVATAVKKATAEDVEYAALHKSGKAGAFDKLNEFGPFTKADRSHFNYIEMYDGNKLSSDDDDDYRFGLFMRMKFKTPVSAKAIKDNIYGADGCYGDNEIDQCDGHIANKSDKPENNCDLCIVSIQESFIIVDAECEKQAKERAMQKLVISIRPPDRYDHWIIEGNIRTHNNYDEEEEVYKMI